MKKIIYNINLRNEMTAMIRTYVGPMFSGKSDALISIYKKIWNKNLVIAFKPRLDVRDKDEIVSKNYEVTIPATYIDDLSEIPSLIKEKGAKTVFIDEAEFLTGDVRTLVDLSVLEEIDFFIAGLNQTAEQKPFGIIGDILAVSDEVHLIRGFCQDCNKESIYTYYEADDKTGDILVGNDNYLSVCPSCLRKRLSKKKVLKHE